MFSIGIDSGSRMTKLCLYDTLVNEIQDYAIEETSADHERLLDAMVKNILAKNEIELSRVKSIVCTGYGRKNYSKATKHSSEIICHAKGVNYFNKDIKTIIEVGGQDSKIIKLSNQGKVTDFFMNDKCAAGTGRFLEKVAHFFSVELSELETLSGLSQKNLEMSSTCVVFAESEMIGLLSSGEKKEDIIKAVHTSIAHRIYGMSGNFGIELPVAFVGGVARNRGMVRALEECLETEIFVPELANMTGAVGAALSNDRSLLV